MIPEVSVIMPVFNAENTVSRMIDSIISQTLSEWELVCVDDGSTDKSGEILDRYSKEDNRVKVIHKQNEGVSAARQDGLDAARGEYIIHVDADDWVDSSMLEDMVNEMNTTDVLITDYFCHSNDTVKVIKQKPSSMSSFLVMRELFQHIHGSCCNKMVRRSIIGNSVRFIKGLNFCEDTLFWIQLFSNNNVRINYLEKAFYHYFVNEKSITQNYSYALYKQTVFFIDKLEEFYPDNYDKEEIIKRCKLNVKFAALYGAKCFTSKEYRSIFPECNKYIMQYNTSLINRILMLLSIIPGMFSVATNIFRYKNIISGHQVFNADGEK